MKYKIYYSVNLKLIWGFSNLSFLPHYSHWRHVQKIIFYLPVWTARVSTASKNCLQKVSLLKQYSKFSISSGAECIFSAQTVSSTTVSTKKGLLHIQHESLKCLRNCLVCRVILYLCTKWLVSPFDGLQLCEHWEPHPFFQQSEGTVQECCLTHLLSWYPP